MAKFKDKLNTFFEKTILKITWFKKLSDEYGIYRAFGMIGGVIASFFMSVLNFVFFEIYNSYWYLTMAVLYLIFFIQRECAIFITCKSILKSEDLNKKKRWNKKAVYLSGALMIIVISIPLCGATYYMASKNISLGKEMIPAITQAAYVFFKLSKAIFNSVKNIKTEDWVIKAIYDVNLVDGIVAMYFLETMMLCTFGNMEDDLYSLVGYTGIVVNALIFAFGIYMLVFYILAMNKEKRRGN